MNNELLQKAKDHILKQIIETSPETGIMAGAYLSLCQAEQTEVYTQLQAAQEPLQMEAQRQIQDD